MKPGLIGNKPGDTVSLCVDVSRLARGQAFVAILGHLISYEHMGAVSVECLGDCECKKEEVDAHVEGGKFSVFKARTLTLRRAEAAPAAAQLPTPRKECGSPRRDPEQAAGRAQVQGALLDVGARARCATATRPACTTMGARLNRSLVRCAPFLGKSSTRAPPPL